MFKLKRVRSKLYFVIFLIIFLVTFYYFKNASVSLSLYEKQKIQDMLDNDLNVLLQLKKDSENLIFEEKSDYKIELPKQRILKNNKEYLIVEYTKVLI